MDFAKVTQSTYIIGIVDFGKPDRDMYVYVRTYHEMICLALCLLPRFRLGESHTNEKDV